MDVVYGPDDMLEPVIMHLGEAGSYDLTVRILDDEKGKQVDMRRFSDIRVKAGRSKTVLPRFRPAVQKEGYYILEYELK